MSPFVAYWRKMGGGSFIISLVVHMGLVILAYFIVRTVSVQPKPVDFLPGGGGGQGNDAPSTKVQTRRDNIRKSVSQRLVSTSSTAAFTLLDMPEDAASLPDLSSTAGGSKGGGGQGTGTGGGIGSGIGPGSGSGVGPGTLKGYVPSTLFGSLDAGEGLVGTFYDFKRDQEGKATGITAGEYRELLKDFAHGPRGSPPKKRKYYTAGTKLYAKIMMFKGVADIEAGKAFNTPDAGPGLWLAHYTGEVQATQTGSYRLVGWGDNCLVIGFNGKVVLDASDMHYTGAERDDLGAINVPGKPSAFLYAGKSLQLRKGERIRVDMLIGDEGGIFSAGALLQKEGTEMKRVEGGLPDLPALIVAPLGANEMKLFDFIPKENLKGSFFQTRKGFFE